MNYNSELRKLRNAKKKILANILELDKEKDEELIQKLYSELDKKSGEINDYCKLIEEKSTMTYEFFHAMSDVISIYEGEYYWIRNLCYHKDRTLDSEILETYVIIASNVFNNIISVSDISHTYFNRLLKNGSAIKIIEAPRVKFLPRQFAFYKTDEDMGRINPQINLKKFPYIKEFIDYVINFKLENNIDKLSYDELEKLKEDFILLNLENIYNNYEAKQEKRIEESIKSINSECEHNKKLLKRFVKKIEDNR